MIIRPNEFHRIEPVRLNSRGIVIGWIVRYKTDFFYLSHRTDNHFFVKFNGFGIDSVTFMKLLERKFNMELQKRIGVNRYIKGIIIEYQGRREHRFYFADFDTWFLNHEVYGTAKEIDGELQSYGRQFILNKNLMKVMGYAPDDKSI